MDDKDQRIYSLVGMLMRMRDRWWPFVHGAFGASETARALLKESADVINGAQFRVDMILYCPNCGEQHIDAPDPSVGWTNPPHRSHLCHACGCVWRPADVPTNGVASIETEGEADTWPVYAGEVVAAEAKK